VGELLDKISILEIKILQVKQPQYNQRIQAELAALYQELDRLQLPEASLKPYLAELQKINQSLWKLENNIRSLMKVQEQSKDQDEQLMKVAQAICRYNDRRAFVKQKVNEAYNSSLRDVKVYTKTL
jgi:hypothetical protein